jgi:hypothetical protein
MIVYFWENNKERERVKEKRVQAISIDRIVVHPPFKSTRSHRESILGNMKGSNQLYYSPTSLVMPTFTYKKTKIIIKNIYTCVQIICLWKKKPCTKLLGFTLFVLEAKKNVE